MGEYVSGRVGVGECWVGVGEYVSGRVGVGASVFGLGRCG